MASLSVIIITKNEEKNIRACLESVAWVDEIIVVDSGSSDATVKICQEYGAKVYEHNWPGFGVQKNRALGYATNEWVLSIDADERITPELRAEIEAVIALGQAESAYRIPRLSSFCGRYMRHSGWYPDYVVRLFRQDAGKFSDDLVHEKLNIDGRIGTLQNHFIHETFHDLESLLAKVNQYSSAGADMLNRKNKSTSLKRAVLSAVWAFFRTYILRAGFLDGAEGFMVAVSTAEVTYYRYAKLRLLCLRR